MDSAVKKPSSKIVLNSELKQRLLWALIPGSVALLFILYGQSEIIFLISSVLAMQGWREYSRMMGIKDRPIFYFSGYGALAILLGYSYFINSLSFFWVWFVWILGFFLLYAEPLLTTLGIWIAKGLAPKEGFFKIQRKENYDAALDWTHLCRYILGIFYIYMIFGFIGPITTKSTVGNFYLLTGLMVVFAGDSAAYFGGKAWGKNKLWPQLSPNKTVEGAAAGFLGSFLGALLIWGLTKLFMAKPLDLSTCLIMGVICPPLGQAADFLESLMKRVSGRKDSGGMLPGHGGLLDRVDGLAFVMPIIYFLT